MEVLEGLWKQLASDPLVPVCVAESVSARREWGWLCVLLAELRREAGDGARHVAHGGAGTRRGGAGDGGSGVGESGARAILIVAISLLPHSPQV